MSTFTKVLMAVALIIGFSTATLRQAVAQTSVPVYFEQQADTYAEWEWDCTYYIDYVYIDSFPDAWRPGWYHGSDWYWGSDWDGWVPSGYWQPYVAQSCYWVLANVYDVAVAEVDTQQNCIYEVTFTTAQHGSFLRPIIGMGWPNQTWEVLPHEVDVVSVSAVEKCPAITSTTVATIPQNRARKKLGVGEAVTLQLGPALDPDLGDVSWWIVSGSGAFANCNLVTLWGGCRARNPTFIAHDRASTTVIEAGYGAARWPVTFTVVEPTGITIERVPGTGLYHFNGKASVGFKGKAWYSPTDVSFAGIWVRERGYAQSGESFNVPGTGTGFYAVWNGYQHDLGAWRQVQEGTETKGSQDGAVDQIESGDKSPPFSNGTFTWSIPWEYRVGNGQGKVFVYVTHHVTATDTGRATVAKGGHSESREASDPHSSW